MASKIETLTDRDGNTVYPTTLTTAIFDADGNNLQETLSTMSSAASAASVSSKSQQEIDEMYDDMGLMSANIDAISQHVGTTGDSNGSATAGTVMAKLNKVIVDDSSISGKVDTVNNKIGTSSDNNDTTVMGKLNSVKSSIAPLSNIGNTGDSNGSATAGTVMAKLNKLINDISSHVSAWTSTRAGYIDNINDKVGSNESKIDTLQSTVSSLQSTVNTLQSNLSSGSYNMTRYKYNAPEYTVIDSEPISPGALIKTISINGPCILNGIKLSGGCCGYLSTKITIDGVDITTVPAYEDSGIQYIGLIGGVIATARCGIDYNDGYGTPSPLNLVAKSNVTITFIGARGVSSTSRIATTIAYLTQWN